MAETKLLLGQTPDNCQENELRLVDGPNYGSGRVEVWRFGCWGTVCDEGWDRDDTNVACRQVGFETNKAIPTKGGYFGNVSSDTPIHVLEAKCGRGGDRLLVSCSSFVLADNNCTHSQDAGVFCNG